MHFFNYRNLTTCYQMKESDGDVYIFQSGDESGIHHQVQLLMDNCPQGKCVPVCVERECVLLCRHMMTCTCYDYLHGHLCKHCHKVQIILKNGTETSHTIDEPVFISPPQYKEHETGMAHLKK